MRSVSPELNLSDNKRVHIERTMGKQCKCDMTEHYLSYPKPGETGHFHFYCDHCEAEYEIPFTIGKATIQITFDEKEV